MSKERNNVTSQSMPYSAIAYKWLSTVKNMLKEFEEFGQFGLSLENPQSTDQNVKNSFNQYMLAGLILVVIVVALTLIKRKWR